MGEKLEVVSLKRCKEKRTTYATIATNDYQHLRVTHNIPSFFILHVHSRVFFSEKFQPKLHVFESLWRFPSPSSPQEITHFFTFPLSSEETQKSCCSSIKAGKLTSATKLLLCAMEIHTCLDILRVLNPPKRRKDDALFLAPQRFLIKQGANKRMTIYFGFTK